MRQGEFQRGTVPEKDLCQPPLPCSELGANHLGVIDALGGDSFPRTLSAAPVRSAHDWNGDDNPAMKKKTTTTAGSSFCVPCVSVCE
jgi:hypothetical protein